MHATYNLALFLSARAFLLLLYSVSTVGKPGGRVVGCDLGQGVGKGCVQTLQGASLGRTELLFDH